MHVNQTVLLFKFYNYPSVRVWVEERLYPRSPHHSLVSLRLKNSLIIHEENTKEMNV